MIGKKLKTAGDFLVAPSPQQIGGLAPAWLVRRPRLGTALIAGFIVVCYCLLINPYWHFSVDSALYLTLGRNLMEGHGYTFNGVHHSQVPGGWAYTLSLLLRVSPAFLWLNVVQTCIVLAGLAVLYLSFREMVGPAGAAAIVLLTAFSIWVYEYSMALMSEGPFFLCSSITVFLALKATRAESPRARAVFTVGVCASAAVAFIFRLVGCFWLGPLAVALLLENRAERRLPARLAAAAAICAVLVGCYFAYQHWGRSVLEGANQVGPDPDAPQVEAGQTAYARPNVNRRGLVFNATSAVFWPSWVLWPPTGVAQRMRLRAVAWLLAWIPNLIVLLGCYRSARRGQILMAASILFFAPFILWSAGRKPTTGRYAIAVVPFVMALFLLGLRQVGEAIRDRLRIPLKPGVLVALGAASILLPGLMLFSVDACVQRSPDYYAAYRGGGYAGMMGALKWLGDHNVSEPIASRDHATIRAVVSLTGYRSSRMGSNVKPIDADFEEAARAFAAESGVRWMLTMDKHRSHRWPLWHIPRQWLRGKPLPPDYWQIWHCDAATGELIRVPVGPLYRWPTRLPPGRH